MLDHLLRAALDAGAITQQVEANEFLSAVASLCHGAGADAKNANHVERMVRLLLAGLCAPSR